MKMGHVGPKTRSLGLVYALETRFSVDTHEAWSEFLPR